MNRIFINLLILVSSVQLFEQNYFLINMLPLFCLFFLIIFSNSYKLLPQSDFQATVQPIVSISYTRAIRHPALSQLAGGIPISTSSIIKSKHVFIQSSCILLLHIVVMMNMNFTHYCGAFKIPDKLLPSGRQNSIYSMCYHQKPISVLLLVLRD